HRGGRGLRGRARRRGRLAVGGRVGGRGARGQRRGHGRGGGRGGGRRERRRGRRRLGVQRRGGGQDRGRGGERHAAEDRADLGGGRRPDDVGWELPHGVVVAVHVGVGAVQRAVEQRDAVRVVHARVADVVGHEMSERLVGRAAVRGDVVGEEPHAAGREPRR